MNRPGRASAGLRVLLLALLASCRCGEPGGPRAYDVGVPLGDLPASSGDLSNCVSGPVLAYGEVQDGRELAQAVSESGWFRALQKNGGARALALSGPAATLTALAQRLNDLSRSPIGEEALSDLLDGPMAVAVKARSHGGFDLLLLKSITPRAAGALRLARMLEAVHPSASEVGIERHLGLPVRALRLDGTRRLYYVVLRDRLLVATDAAWLRDALDLSLDRALPRIQPSVHALKQAAAHARGFALIDGAAAARSPTLGIAGRSLAGLAWLGMRWNVGSVELGAHRASGTFGPPGPPLAIPAGTALALAREATLDELLQVPARGASTPDAGADPHAAGRALLVRVAATLGPTIGDHVAYLLASEADHTPEQLLAMQTRTGAGAASALDSLVPQLFRVPAARHDELVPGARCEGNPPVACWGQLGPVLALGSAPSALRAEAEALHGNRTVTWGPLALFVDPAAVAQLLAREGANHRRAGGPGEVDPLVSALRTSRPLFAQLGIGPRPNEAWGTLGPIARPPEPRREQRDGGGP